MDYGPAGWSTFLPLALNAISAYIPPSFVLLPVLLLLFLHRAQVEILSCPPSSLYAEQMTIDSCAWSDHPMLAETNGYWSDCKQNAGFIGAASVGMTD